MLRFAIEKLMERSIIIEAPRLTLVARFCENENLRKPNVVIKKKTW